MDLSFTCTPRVHPLTESTTPSFAFPAEVDTHLPRHERLLSAERKYSFLLHLLDTTAVRRMQLLTAANI